MIVILILLAVSKSSEECRRIWKSLQGSEMIWKILKKSETIWKVENSESIEKAWENLNFFHILSFSLRLLFSNS